MRYYIRSVILLRIVDAFAFVRLFQLICSFIFLVCCCSVQNEFSNFHTNQTQRIVLLLFLSFDEISIAMNLKCAEWRKRKQENKTNKSNNRSWIQESFGSTHFILLFFSLYLFSDVFWGQRTWTDLTVNRTTHTQSQKCLFQ